MLGSFLGKFLGPKVMTGVLLAAVSAIGVLFWQWQSASESSARAEHQAQSYRVALVESEQELARQTERRKAMERAITQQQARAQAARERAETAEQALQRLEAGDEEVASWSGASVPPDVLDWLRDKR